MAKQLSSEDLKVVSRLIEALEALRELDPEMPIQTILTLLQVAKKEGQSGIELSKLMALPISSMSRNLQALSEVSRLKDKDGNRLPGLNVINWDFGATDYRTKYAHLTRKGHELLARLLAPLKR